MKNPLVSVIVTCYNYGEYIEKAIRSVWDQTYKNIELIVINDGSDDNSDSVITSLCKLKEFNYINQKNLGIVETRNKGMRLSNGQYVMQLDADDWIENNYISKCLESIKNNAVDVAYTQTKIFGRTSFQSSHIEFDIEKLKHDNFINASALIKKECLKANPYDQYLNDKGNEDWDLFLGLALNGVKFKLVNEPLLNYRKHIDRKSRSDEFEGLYKEMLVRHHIWNKYNTQYPDQFWYFSSQIDMLFEMIKLHQQYEAQESNIKQLNITIVQNNHTIALFHSRIKKLEKRDLITINKKVLRKIKKSFK